MEMDKNTNRWLNWYSLGLKRIFINNILYVYASNEFMLTGHEAGADEYVSISQVIFLLLDYG